MLGTVGAHRAWIGREVVALPAFVLWHPVRMCVAVEVTSAQHVFHTFLSCAPAADAGWLICAATQPAQPLVPHAAALRRLLQQPVAAAADGEHGQPAWSHAATAGGPPCSPPGSVSRQVAARCGCRSPCQVLPVVLAGLAVPPFAVFAVALLTGCTASYICALLGCLPSQTPTSAGPQQLPFSPGSFQPSSVSTYQAALAAAQAALQQPQAGQLSQQSNANAAGAAAAGTSWGAWRLSTQPWSQQQQARSHAGFSPVQAAAAATVSAALAGSSIQQLPGGLPAGMLQQQLRSGLPTAGGTAAGSSRWTSMDGSSPGGTPPLAGMPSAEDVPNPADFDPLWR